LHDATASVKQIGLYNITPGKQTKTDILKCWFRLCCLCITLSVTCLGPCLCLFITVGQRSRLNMPILLDS